MENDQNNVTDDAPELTPEAVEKLGLKPVRAFVKDQKKQRNKNAERQAKLREKDEAAGVKTLSIGRVPVELHEAIKAFAAELAGREPPATRPQAPQPSSQASSAGVEGRQPRLVAVAVAAFVVGLALGLML